MLRSKQTRLPIHPYPLRRANSTFSMPGSCGRYHVAMVTTADVCFVREAMGDRLLNVQIHPPAWGERGARVDTD